MGDPEGWPQPSGLLPDGSPTSVPDDARWAQAESRTADLITQIQPTRSSELRRRAVANHVQRLIRKCFDCEVFTFGSVPLKTYLPDGDIDLTAFSMHQHLKDSWATEVRAVLEAEERSKEAEFRVKEVQYIQAEVKLIKCLVENIVVDISFNQLGGLCTLCFLEEVDRLIGRDHLFKRSIILVKAWCYYESRILGAHHGLISTYALETLVLYIFHVFHASLRGPLGVLFRFLEFFSNFDWDKYCVSLWGPIPLSALPDMPAEPPRKDGGPLLLTKAFLDACARAYQVLPNGTGIPSLPNPVFSSKYFNVVDPLRTTNNLGRSVSKGNFFRIRSAFSYGARKLARILECPIENVTDELDKFFLNTWDRHGSGRRSDAPECIERLSAFESATPGDENPEEGHEKKAPPALTGELLQELNTFALRSKQTNDAAWDSNSERLRFLPLGDQRPEAANHLANSLKEPSLSESQKQRSHKSEDAELTRQRSHKSADESRTNNEQDFSSIFPVDTSTKGLQPSTWGNADVPPFYPRSAPLHVNQSELEDVSTAPKQANWDSSRGFSMPVQHPLPVPGPPPPPLNLHPASDGRLPSFAGQFPMLRGPVPPPLPPYGRSGVQRVIEGDGQYLEENQRGKESEDFAEQNRVSPSPKLPNAAWNGSRELSPDAAAFYEQNGEDEGIKFGWHANGHRGANEDVGRRKPGDDLPETGRIADGAGPSTTEAWPALDAPKYQYSQMGHVPGPLVYTGPSPPEPPASPSSDTVVSTAVSYSLHAHRVPASFQPPSIGIPVNPGVFVRPSTSETTVASAGRKQRPVENQAAPSFYYAPFPYMPLYNSFPVYVLPPEDGESSNEQQHEDTFGVRERLLAAGIPVSSAGKQGAEQSSERQDSQSDLLTSDFAHHLRNLDFGRACQSPVPVFLQPGFPPFAKELQGHYIWEGPGRPVQSNMKHGSRAPRNLQRSFPSPPGFGDDSIAKARSGTGTYLPGARQTYRDRQFKAQHEGYQEREYAEREAPRRSMGRGQNRGKAGDNSNTNNTNINNFHRNPVLPTSVLEAYTHTYMNGNGSSPSGPPLILVYPSNDPLSQQHAVEFGSVSSLDHPAAGHGRGRTSSTNQQPPSPKNQQRASERSYEMKEEDFPPLSFRGASSSASTSSSKPSFQTQTYVASQS